MRKKSKLPVMKTKTLNLRCSDKYADKLAILKLRKGGITGFFEGCLDKMEVTEEELEAVKLLRR